MVKWPRGLPFPRRCRVRASGGPGSRTGRSPAGVAGAAGVLDAGDRAPIIGGCGERLPRGWVCVYRLSAPHGRLAAGQARWLHSSLRLSPAWLPGGMGRVRVRAGRGQSGGRPRRRAGRAAGARRGAECSAASRPVAGQIAGGRGPGQGHAAWRGRGGQAADVPVAHAVEDQGEQLAGGGDLGDVLGLLAAAGDDAVLDLPRPRARRAAAGSPRAPPSAFPLLCDRVSFLLSLLLLSGVFALCSVVSRH